MIVASLNVSEKSAPRMRLEARTSPVFTLFRRRRRARRARRAETSFCRLAELGERTSISCAIGMAAGGEARIGRLDSSLCDERLRLFPTNSPRLDDINNNSDNMVEARANGAKACNTTLLLLSTTRTKICPSPKQERIETQTHTHTLTHSGSLGRNVTRFGTSRVAEKVMSPLVGPTLHFCNIMSTIRSRRRL